MKIAVIGSGISGITCGWLLHQRHDLTIFESQNYIGGHTHTVDCRLVDGDYSIDTGFIVCNDRTYPNFLKLLDHLNVSRSATTMGFSVRCDRSGLEYCGSGLSGLFAQRRNLLRPSFLKMVADILRFNREGSADAESVSHELTVGEYLVEHHYSDAFANHYLLPMGAAIWSCPTGTFRSFPIRFILEFYRHHGLLSLTDRPTWYVIDGGSKNYVDALTKPFRDRIFLNTPVSAVRRTADCIEVLSSRGCEEFDEVIFACHSDQAQRLLTNATAAENEVLAAFPYERNDAVLHTDISVLPRRRSAWASWNYRIPDGTTERPTVTYHMNMLQHVPSTQTVCVSLNDTDSISPDRILGRYQYSHPVFTTQRHRMQQRHAELIRHDRVSFCGAYWGNGFHEDGVVSALAVCRQYGAQDVLDTALSDAGELTVRDGARV
ncbi:MAG: FAD-dependent oxidoreductase [Planctomycetaceae bacterium]